MTNKEILEKAIQKAIDGGYSKQVGQKITSLKDEWITYSSDHQKEYSEQVANLIFDHSFAKALWGEDKKNPSPLIVEYSIIRVPEGMDARLEQARENYEVKEWQYHLQNMVISENPIEYLGASL